MPICIEIGSFVFEVGYSVHKLVRDEQTDKRTDERTKGQVENIMRPASLEWCADIQYMFAVVIAFVCFYHAERILFAITKLIVHLFGEAEGQVDVGEGRSWKRVRKEGEGMQGVKIDYGDVTFEPT